MFPKPVKVKGSHHIVSPSRDPVGTGKGIARMRFNLTIAFLAVGGTAVYGILTGQANAAAYVVAMMFALIPMGVSIT